MIDKVIYAGKLAGMAKDTVSEKMVVSLEGDRIAKVARQDQFTPPKGVPVIDWSGYMVMPGLIDCHDHLGFDVGNEEAQANENDFINVLRSVRNAKAMLRAGITTLRTMGEKRFMDIHVKKAIEAGWIRGPRLVTSGQLIAKTGGHAWYIGVEADGVDGLKRAIRQQAKAGTDWIKIMITGGVSTEGSDPTAPEYSVEEIRTAVEEAHRCHRKIAAHAHGGPGAMAGIEAGMDSIEHGVYLSEEELQRMAKKGTFLVMTYGVMVMGGQLPHVPEFMKKKCIEATGHYLQTLRKARAVGVKIVFGGDTYHADPKSELEALVQAGFSNQEALQAGTLLAAELLGLQGRLGSVEEGKLADLVAVNGDPIGQIADIAKVVGVIKGGEVQVFD